MPIADIQIINTADICQVSRDSVQSIKNVNKLAENTTGMPLIAEPKYSPKQIQQELRFDLSNSVSQKTKRKIYYNCCTDTGTAFSLDMSEIGKTPLISHSIDTTDEIPARAGPYKTSPEMKKAIEEEVQKLLDNEIIEHSSSDYSNPVILVRKPNNTFRLVADYRKFNTKIKDVIFPLPLLSDIVDQIGTNKSKYFSTLDLRSCY